MALLSAFVGLGRSVVRGEARSLVGQRSALAAIIAGAPSAALAETGTTALPGLRALLGSLPVVGFRDGAVLIVRAGLSVVTPVAGPEFLGVVVVLTGLRNVGGGEADRGLGGNDRNECSESVFHNNYNKCSI